MKLEFGADGTRTPVAAGASALPIQDGGNSLTVDGTVAITGAVDVTGSTVAAVVSGTVTANAGTNLNTSALALEAGGNLAAAVASLAVLDNIVAGAEAQVDIVAALPAGNNNIGDVDIASIAAGDNNIGNVDVVTLPALVAGTAFIGYVGHGKTLKTVSGSLTADTDIITAVATKRLKVVAFSLVSNGTNANTVIFKSNGTSGTELWRVLLQSSANIAAGANLAISAPSFLFATVAGEKLTLDVSAADTIHYSVTYFDDDVA